MLKDNWVGEPKPKFQTSNLEKWESKDTERKRPVE